MQSEITSRLITAAADDVPALRHAVCHHLHTCANCISGRLTGSHQFEFDPMIPVSNLVPQQCRLAIEIVYHYVDMAIIEEVTGRRAPTRDWRAQTTSSSRRYDSEPLAAQILKQERALSIRGAPVLFVDTRIHVTVGYKKVEPSIVVVVEEPSALTEKRDRGFQQSGEAADVFE